VKETDKENKGGCLHKSSDAHKFERCDKDKKPARMCVCVFMLTNLENNGL